MGTELRGKTLGIIGLGNVGSEVARRAHGFEMKLMGCDPLVSIDYAKKIQVELVELKQLFKESDFITLHLPLTSQTRGLIGAKELAMMKPSVRIVNCARGGLIDEESLVKAIREKKVAGVAVDVFDVYSGEQVPPGKKSLAYRLTYQSRDHTLTDKEVNKVQEQILKKLEKELGATLRA